MREVGAYTAIFRNDLRADRMPAEPIQLGASYTGPTGLVRRGLGDHEGKTVRAIQDDDQDRHVGIETAPQLGGNIQIGLDRRPGQTTGFVEYGMCKLTTEELVLAAEKVRIALIDLACGYQRVDGRIIRSSHAAGRRKQQRCDENHRQAQSAPDSLTAIQS